jgi:ABC-2 type transport system ATP-binding protein
MSTDSDAAVAARSLAKRFGPVVALRGFDLTVPPATVCALLGPNGAGKTTAVRILTTLLRPDTGTARVAGFDVTAEPHRVRGRIGLAGQHTAIDEKLTGRENLQMFGQLYRLSARRARRRADELLAQFDLVAAADRVVRTYSGGMRRRLDLAVSLVLAPAVLFLDEPTTGLDPTSRSEVWHHVRSLVRDGTTVLLTTQYLDEADQLAGRIVVIADGRVIASGSPTELKARVGADRLEIVAAGPELLARAAAVLDRVTGARSLLEPDSSRASAPTSRGFAALAEVVRELERAGIAPQDVGLRRPTLDDVFLHLTARPATDDKREEANR